MVVTLDGGGGVSASAGPKDAPKKDAPKDKPDKPANKPAETEEEDPPEVEEASDATPVDDTEPATVEDDNNDDDQDEQDNDSSPSVFRDIADTANNIASAISGIFSSPDDEDSPDEDTENGSGDSSGDSIQDLITDNPVTDWVSSLLDSSDDADPPSDAAESSEAEAEAMPVSNPITDGFNTLVGFLNPFGSSQEVLETDAVEETDAADGTNPFGMIGEFVTSLFDPPAAESETTRVVLTDMGYVLVDAETGEFVYNRDGTVARPEPTFTFTDGLSGGDNAGQTFFVQDIPTSECPPQWLPGGRCVDWEVLLDPNRPRGDGGGGGDPFAGVEQELTDAVNNISQGLNEFFYGTPATRSPSFVPASYNGRNGFRLLDDHGNPTNIFVNVESVTNPTNSPAINFGVQDTGTGIGGLGGDIGADILVNVPVGVGQASTVYNATYGNGQPLTQGGFLMTANPAHGLVVNDTQGRNVYNPNGDGSMLLFQDRDTGNLVNGQGAVVYTYDFATRQFNSPSTGPVDVPLYSYPTYSGTGGGHQVNSAVVPIIDPVSGQAVGVQVSLTYTDSNGRAHVVEQIELPLTDGQPASSGI